MTVEILTLLGGIGMFLFGMHTMTGALRQLASGQMRAILSRMTRSPATGAAAGAISTALVHSSSAVMVTTIGFVGAGLITFSQSIGIIYGANVGTTVTGWMVALLGLKLKIGVLALPVLLAGALLQLLGRGKWARTGAALAGASLLFLGLDMMQDGARVLQGYVTPQSFPADSLGGRARLLLIGLVITVVIQSSSAGVAMTLVMISAGTLTLGQGAAMIIGMDIGTTFTGMLATIGGSRAMRRTAVAHVAYNIVTGIAAFASLGVAVPMLLRVFGGDAPEALVAFHTLFNLLGVCLMLPVTAPFARFIEWLVPDRGTLGSAVPDRSLLEDAGAALDSAGASATALASALFSGLGAVLAPAPRRAMLEEVRPGLEAALDDLEDYLTRIRVPEGQQEPLARYSALLHQADHLRRLAGRSAQEDMLPLVLEDRMLHRPALAFGAALRRAGAAMADPREAARFDRLSRTIAGRTARLRRSALLREHLGMVSTAGVFDLTDAMRWLQRSAEHAERILHYGQAAAPRRP